MSSQNSIWKKIRKKVRSILCNSKDYDDCSKEKRQIVRKALSSNNDDMEKRIHRLHKALKANYITKKQYRLAKKLIVASYK
ncbi:MAG: hypothetical protein HQL70_00205 [Magnetococcales bacterium]|nr:hypothetical protein [Magnetococcales bacterium]